MKNLIVRSGLIFSLFFVFFAFQGCSKPDIEVQKKECIDQNKNFLTKKVLNFRSGEYEIKVECI